MDEYYKELKDLVNYKKYHADDIFPSFMLKSFRWLKQKVSLSFSKQYAKIRPYLWKMYMDSYSLGVFLYKSAVEFEKEYIKKTIVLTKKPLKAQLKKHNLQTSFEETSKGFNYKIRPFMENAYSKWIFKQCLSNYNTDKYIEFEESKEATKINYFYKGWIQHIEKFSRSELKNHYGVDWGSCYQLRTDIPVKT